MKDLTISPMPVQQARTLVELHHYMHRKPQVSHSYGLYRGTEPVGVAALN